MMIGFIWLVGNHDISYLSTYSKDSYPPKNSFYECSGWTRNKAKKFNEHINSNWFKKLELCCEVGDYICVHAGFQSSQFKPFLSEINNIHNLYNEWEKDKLTFMHTAYHWIYYVSASRGGLDDHSSPIWVDFSEFVPLDNISQIVGHSNSNLQKVRCKNNGMGLKNYCIDNYRTLYAVWENGNLRFENI